MLNRIKHNPCICGSLTHLKDAYKKLVVSYLQKKSLVESSLHDSDHMNRGIDSYAKWMFALAVSAI